MKFKKEKKNIQKPKRRRKMVVDNVGSGECLNLVVLGIDGIGKENLAQSIVEAHVKKGGDFDDVCTLQVFVTNDLAKSKKKVKRGFDYVVLVTDMKSTLSLERLGEWMNEVNKSYCLGKSCLVVTGSESPADFAYSLDTVTTFSQTYGLETFFCGNDTSSTAIKIVNACMNCRRRKSLSPLFVSCLDDSTLLL